MKALRTLVVGLGRVGWPYHLPQVAAREDFELLGVVDPLTDRLEEARARYGARGYTDYAEALEKERPELVVIASPTPFHAEQAIAAFRCGADVFCDKPVAASLAETDAMIAALREQGRKMMVYQPHRATVETVALRDILRRDLLGPVYLMKRACTNYVRRDDWQARRAHAGGMLNNYGAHYVDQLLHLSDYAARHVTCRLRTIASLGDAEDVVKAVIETEGGVILDVDVNMAAAQPLPPWHILGRRGSAVLDPEAKGWRVRYFVEADLPPGALQTSLAAAGRRYAPPEHLPWREEIVPLSGYKAIDYYTECHAFFAEDREPFVPLCETRELMRVLDLCRKAAED